MSAHSGSQVHSNTTQSELNLAW